MTIIQRESFDPATLAASVRDVALQARRLLRDNARKPYEVGALASQINALQSQARGFSSDELSRWLDNLSRQVESDRGPVDPPRLRGFERASDLGLN